MILALNCLPVAVQAQAAKPVDIAIARGITVNGLIMARGKAVPVLSRYFQREVIGGPAAFLQVSLSNDDFANAMLRKVLLEMVRLRQPNAADFDMAGGTALDHQ